MLFLVFAKNSLPIPNTIPIVPTVAQAITTGTIKSVFIFLTTFFKEITELILSHFIHEDLIQVLPIVPHVYYTPMRKLNNHQCFSF